MTTIVELLGGGKILSAKVQSEIELIDMVQACLPPLCSGLWNRWN
ncbi:MAG: hypothetical protein ABI876_02025 [Bacteroidota bacterium]